MSFFTNISTKGKVRYGRFPFAISVLESPNSHVPIGMAFSATATDGGFGAVAFPRTAWTHFFCLLSWPFTCGLIVKYHNVRLITINSPPIEGSAMAKFQLPDEIQEKLERAAHLRWVEPQDNPHKIHEIADERTALRAELTTMFGSLIQQLVNADILSADVPENASFFGATASINDVHIDDEFGIILDCVPSRE